MIKAVLFDMDGTILNTLPDMTNSVNYALEKMGCPTRTMEEIGSFVGNGIRQVMKLALPEDASELMLVQSIEYWGEHYSEHSQDFTAPYDGVIELMEKLRKLGLPYGIVSNKVHSSVLELNDSFFKADVAVGEQERYARKPAPDMLIAAMETLGVTSDECAYIGDTEVDYMAATNTKLMPIIVSWGFRPRTYLEEICDCEILDTTDEVYEFIRQRSR